jgi:hypothetical protein
LRGACFDGYSERHARVFITGVLPITIDDLTSDFNIAQIITLEEHTFEMMGFTQAEVDAYVGAIFAERDWPDTLQRRVLEDLLAHYNGYRLLPDARETLYRTLCPPLTATFRARLACSCPFTSA